MTKGPDPMTVEERDGWAIEKAVNVWAKYHHVALTDYDKAGLVGTMRQVLSQLVSDALKEPRR